LPRHVLCRSIATLLAPAIALLGSIALQDTAHATVTATEAGGVLTVTVGAAGDNPTLSTTTSGGNIHVVGNGFTGDFSGVTQIHINLAQSGETPTFDSSNFSFNAPVTINDTGGTANSITKNGPNAVTINGASTYANGTGINGGVLIVNNGASLGTGQVQLKTGGELRGSGTLTMANEIDLLSGTNTISTNSTFTVSNLNLQGAVNFGSAGNAGTVVVNSNPDAVSPSSTIDVAFGTLRNGGGLNFYTSTAGTTTVNAGATLSINDLSMTVKNLKGAGAVSLGTKAATQLTLGSANFTGVISGAGGLKVNTAGTVDLIGTNTYTGGTTMSAGTLELGNGGTTGSVTGSIGDNGALVFYRSNAITYSGVISGTGNVSNSGTGLLTLSGNNSYSGGTFINAGVVIATNANALGSSSSHVTLAVGTELRGSGTFALPNEIDFATNNSALSTNGTLTVSDLHTQGVVTFGSSGNAGTIVVVPGASNAAPNTGVRVAFGTLSNGGALNSLTAPALSASVETGATLSVNDFNMTVNNLGGGGSITLGTKTATVLTVNGANFLGSISGAGQVHVTGATVLYGGSTYTGGTTIDNGATLDLGAGSNTATIAGNIVNNGVLNFGEKTAVTYNGNISGTGGVEQIGPGTVTLGGNSTYNGITTIAAGTLVVTNANALGFSSVNMGSHVELRGSGTFALANPIVLTSGAPATISTTGTLTVESVTFNPQSELIIGSAGNAGTVVFGPLGANSGRSDGLILVSYGTLRNGGTLSSLTATAAATTLRPGTTLSLNDNNLEVLNLLGPGSVTLGTKSTTSLFVDGGDFFGVISGAGKVVVSGNPLFSGANTYTGGTTINQGVLEIGGNGSVAGNILDNALLAFDRSTAYTFSGVISGVGAVSVDGGAPITLSGSNTYTGGTTIQSGVLAATNASAFGTGPVTLAINTELRGAGTFALNNEIHMPTTGATISSTGTLTLNKLDMQGQVTFGSPGNTGTVVIGSAGPLNHPSIVVAYGTLRNGVQLSFDTENSSSTTVNAGATLSLNDLPLTVNTLEGAGSVSLGTKASTVLTLIGAQFGGVISGAGQVDFASGSSIITGTQTYTGGTTIESGAFLQVGGVIVNGTLAGNITNNGRLLFADRTPATYSGVISGPGSVDQAGNGAITLSGANTYTGGTKISEAPLIATNASSFGTGVVTLGVGAELRGAGTFALNNEIDLPTSGTGTISTNGTLTLNNLHLQGSAVFGSAGNAGTIVIGSTLTVSGSATIELAFGTLRDGGIGWLGYATAHSTATTVDAGATLGVNDLTMTVQNLQGAGAVTLGTKANTMLTLQSGTFGGGISGAGQVNVTGQMIFTGANTYTGGTTIANGADLYIGNFGTTGSISGNVVDNGQLTFRRTNALTMAGTISGTGQVWNYAGVLTLSGHNSYSGGTSIQGGVVVAANANSLGSGAVQLVQGGELRTSGTFTLANEIDFPTGETSTLSTNGILTANDINLQGGHAIFGSAGNAGTVVIGSQLSLNLASPPTIDVAYGTLRDGGIGWLGYATANSASTTVNTGATLGVNDLTMTIKNLLGAGSVTLGTKANTSLTLNAANFSGVIGGAGKVVSNGIVTLSGASTYTGGTIIGSTTIVNNTSGSATGTGPVEIQSGATLGGNGTIGGAITLDSGGAIAPGFGTAIGGTKMHAKSLLWDGGSILDFHIGSTADELMLTGALTKGTAGTFTIQIDNENIAAGNYTLLTFASTTFSLSDFTVQYPVNFTGTLVETGTSLSIQNLHDPPPGSVEMPAADLAPASSPSEELISPAGVPEPTSAMLLAFGGGVLLGWRRRR
jgi:autotransporter-associated beta strand protein